MLAKLQVEELNNSLKLFVPRKDIIKKKKKMFFLKIEIYLPSVESKIVQTPYQVRE